MDFRPAPPSPFRTRWLDLTPLIDIIFLLLLFFLLATRFINHSAIALDLPPASEARSAAARNAEKTQGWRGAILVRLHRDGRIDVNGQTLPLTDVAARIKRLVDGGDGARAVLIRPAVGLPLQPLITAVDQVRAGGARSVSLVR